jgi:hypothetical protein
MNYKLAKRQGMWDHVEEIKKHFSKIHRRKRGISENPDTTEDFQYHFL